MKERKIPISLEDLNTIPQNKELEENVLGALINSPEETKEEICSILNTSCFYHECNKTIFATLHKLMSDHKPTDVLGIAMALKSEEKLEAVGGALYLHQITSKSSPAFLADNARMLKQYAVKRDVFFLSDRMKAMSVDPMCEAQEVIEETEKKLTEMQSSDETKIDSIVDNISEFYDWLMAQQNHKSAIATGLEGLDEILNGGFRGPDLIVLGGRPSMGKALRIDSHVLTPSGWKLMGDIKVGDEVVSIDGKKSYVTGVFPQGELETYKVTFNDGRTTECCGEHLWEVYSTKFGKHGGDTRVMNTKQIAEKLQAKRFKGRMSIPKFSGICGEHKEFVIHPYILGILLGDGCLSKGTSWCKPDMFIKEKIESLLPYGYTISQKDEKTFFIINSKKGGTKNIFTEELRELGLIGSHSYDKFIPEKYKMCSREQRVQLLQGLLDSDGWVEKAGAIQFSSSSKQLAQDVQELCWSLGYICSMREKKIFLNGEQKRDAYILCISPENPDECFSLPRKKERADKKRRKRPCTIYSVEKTGRKVECQCISVSHERALYVTDQYIMTHNTQLATFFAENAGLQGKRVYFASIEMTTTQLIGRLVSKYGVSGARMRMGKLSGEEWGQVDNALGEISKLPIVIDGSTNVRYLSHIKSTARKLKRTQGLDMIIIDYLQLIKTNQAFERRYLEIGFITGELKSLAKELNVPIILLAQVSRATMGREMEIPRMEDLRESGDIEQDADVIIFPHRPCEVDKMACDKLGRSWEGRGLLFIAKNREGERNVKTFFMHDTQFKNIWDDFDANLAYKNKEL